MEEAMQRRRLLCQPNSASAANLPDELMVEIISWLPVKHVMQLRCVNKFFKTLIFDPHFVQIHLNKSSQNSHLALKWQWRHNLNDYWVSSLVTLSIPHLLQNQFTILNHSDPYYLLNDYSYRTCQRSRIWQWVVGSCNGLVCLIGVSYPSQDHWLCFWNPAMRTKSKNFTYYNRHFKFSFGYDNSTRTYKAVALYVEVKPGCNPKSVVKVFSLGDNSWRDIQCLPVLPLYWSNPGMNDGVHLNGTINWIALCDYINSNITIDQYVILSLDLSTETYTQLLLPQRFDKVPSHTPKLVVLMDYLCFCHDFEETHFVIWQMKNFGVQDSWVQLFKISYENCFGWVNLLPLYLSKNGDTLILANDEDDEAFIYNRRDNRVEKLGISNHIVWSQAKDYVESLVPIQ